jgi:cytoskeleton protein RodZ
VTVAVPDPNRDANDTQWVASRGTLFGLTEWDRVSGPERGPSLAVEDEDSMDPFPLEAGDSAGIDKMAKNAIARAALGDGSAVTEMILTQAPQFIHPEAPRWTVRVTSPQRTVTVLADRSGKLFPATVAATGPPRIVIHADSGSWIRVRNVDQSDLYEGVLKAGESYGVPNTPGLILRTGNAGALEITVDGKPVPSIGDGLLARRDVRLDTQALLDGTAVLE